MLCWRLMCRGRESRVAASAAPPLRNKVRLSWLCEVDELVPALAIVYDRTYRYGKLDRLTVTACSITALAVTASLGAVLGVIPEM